MFFCSVGHLIQLADIASCLAAQKRFWLFKGQVSFIFLNLLECRVFKGYRLIPLTAPWSFYSTFKSVFFNTIFTVLVFYLIYFEKISYLTALITVIDETRITIRATNTKKY
jgi:hypothetical protein